MSAVGNLEVETERTQIYSLLVHTVSFKEVSNYRNAFLRFCFKHVDLDIRISIMDLEQC